MRELLSFIAEHLQKGVTLFTGPSGHFIAKRDGYVVLPMPIGRADKPTRTHNFSDVDSMAAWLKRHAEPTTTEILIGESAIFAMLDHRWGGDIVKCTPTKSLTVKVIERLVATTKSQQEAFLILSSIKADINDNSVLGQIACLEIKRSGKLATRIDPKTGAKTLVSSESGTDYTISLSPEIGVTCPFFDGGSRTMISLSVMPEVQMDTISLRFGCPSLEYIRKQAWEEQSYKLAKALGDDWLVGFGELVVAQ